MDIREFLTAVGRGYNRGAGMSAPIQALLKRAAQELHRHVPGGIVIMASGGKGFATFTPWIGFFDPDETSSPQDGIYVVYLFAQDLRAVTLTLMQGITKLTRKLGQKRARERLKADAEAIRGALPPASLSGLDTALRLGSKGFRQFAYEAGNIAAKRYDLKDLPAESELREDLSAFISLYQLVVSTKRRLLQAQPGAIASPSTLQQADAAGDPLANFKPKNDADYTAHIVGRLLTKSRRHERLIAEYGQWIGTRGFYPSASEHPRDLVLRKDNVEWLVEGKVLYEGNATDAVRAVIGQLFCYRHFLYVDGRAPNLVGLFTEPVGEAYVRLLEDCGIASVWKTPDGWAGSKMARAHGLTNSPGDFVLPEATGAANDENE